MRRIGRGIRMMSRRFDVVVWAAFGFGAGRIEPAPGTWGTVAAILPYLLFSGLSPMAYATVLVLAFAFGVWLCGSAARRLGVHDHPGIVWDEFVGLWITLFMVEPTVLTVALGFGLFRLFDILKPWPIRWLDRQVPGGLGIMLDDVIAGVMAAACLHAMIVTLPVLA